MRLPPPFLLGLVVATGCATAPATLQTARTVEPGEWRFSTGASIPISTRFVGEVADTAELAADRASRAEEAGEPLTEEEQRELVESALGLILFTPAPTYELGARVGLAQNWDLGFRWAGPMLRGDVKWQLLERPSLDAALLAGYTYHTDTAPSILSSVYSVFESVGVVGYSRHDADLAFLVSGNPEAVVSPYGALRYLAAFTSFETVVEGTDMVTQTESESIMHIVGATGGLRIGTPKIQLQLELTVSYVHLKPTVFGDEVDLGGMLFMPAIGGSFETG